MTEQHTAATSKRTLIETWFDNLSVVDQMETRRWFPDILTEEMMAASLEAIPAHLAESWNAWRSCPEITHVADVLAKAKQASSDTLKFDDTARVKVIGDQVFVSGWVRIPPGEKWLSVELVKGGSSDFPTSRGGWEIKSFNPAHAYCFLDPRTAAARIRDKVVSGKGVRLDFYEGLWLRHSDQHPAETRDRGVALWVADSELAEPFQEDLDILLENIKRWRDGQEWHAIITQGPGRCVFTPVFFTKREMADFLASEVADEDAVGLKIPATYQKEFQQTSFKCPVMWVS